MRNICTVQLLTRLLFSDMYHFKIFFQISQLERDLLKQKRIVYNKWTVLHENA